ncbi:MAG: 3-dehydroquinate dehydratase [Bacteroidetes bacterium]|nr:3-dehydroquinate dehydratase [Bacteroidota bacterium]MBU2465061.1 3-dehydroquinate dehydratase [Bacteroidota bacterium]MBU2556330.1 3-dehydroquinate dehydratase [Bacteroidota bacterium]
MRILILNGPNLNLTGSRETSHYGHETFESYILQLFKLFPQAKIVFKQSNIEGELINILHAATHEFDGVVFNPAAYSHTSIALADAIRAINIPVVEVHMSNIFSREHYRKHSYTAEASLGTLAGFGMEGYRMAVDFLLRKSL